MKILAHIPRIVILLLKTNDLTRYLDESLRNPLGPARGFLILTSYCSSLVLQEDLETAAAMWKDNIYIKAATQYIAAWYKYIATAYVRTTAYEIILFSRDCYKKLAH